MQLLRKNGLRRLIIGGMHPGGTIILGWRSRWTWTDDFCGFRTQVVATTMCATGRRKYTHSAVARTFSLRNVQISRTRMAQGLSVMKRFVAFCMSCLSVSPSPFSCFNRRPCCSLTATFSAPHLCRALPAPKARGMRTPTRGALSIGQIQRTPQVMSPSCSTKTFLWTMT